MWPFALVLGLAIGAAAVWEALKKASAPPPPQPPGLPVAEPVTWRQPTNDAADGTYVALAHTVAGLIGFVGPCALAPTVPATPTAIANFTALVTQRQQALWDFQAAVGLATTGCYDKNTRTALSAYVKAVDMGWTLRNWPDACSCNGAIPISRP